MQCYLQFLPMTVVCRGKTRYQIKLSSRKSLTFFSLNNTYADEGKLYFRPSWNNVCLLTGEIDVTNAFSLTMEVLPSTKNHNGILFSLGTRPNFEYYEWKTAAVNTQFIVVEFIFSAVSEVISDISDLINIFFTRMLTWVCSFFYSGWLFPEVHVECLSKSKLMKNWPSNTSRPGHPVRP